MRKPSNVGLPAVPPPPAPAADVLRAAHWKSTMGSPASERERRDDEMQHTVTLTQGFWMGRHEVSQEE